MLISGFTEVKYHERTTKLATPNIMRIAVENFTCILYSVTEIS